jgi:hypothetical protein
MKNYSVKIALALMLIAFASTASATSGRTNKSGCHNSKKAGYHCH